MAFALDDALVVSREPLVTVVDDATVLLDLRRGCYFSMQQVAGTVWSLLQQPTTLESLLAELMRRYEVDPATCRADTEELLGELVRRGLVMVEAAAR